MTRNGKIARLSANIRDDLNLRLENGGEGAALLAWLNGLPQVQASLKAHFGGAPISKQNLSDWRQGGFREWQIRQEWLDHACHLSDGAGEMEKLVDTASLPGALAAVLAARYAALLNSWDGEADSKIEANLRLLRGLNQDIALLQKTTQRASQYKRELERAAEDQERRELEEEKKRALAPVWAMLESETMAAMLGGGERGRKIADLIAATKHDLPPARERKKAEGRSKKVSENSHRRAGVPPASSGGVPPPVLNSQTHSKKERRVLAIRSKSVKPSQTKSSRVKPSQTESMPAEPSQATVIPVEPNQTTASAVAPSEAKANSVEPSQTPASPVNPSQAESKPDFSAPSMMAEAWERIHKVDSTSSGPTA